MKSSHRITVYPSHMRLAAALFPEEGEPRIRVKFTLEDDRQEWRLAGDWLTESQATLRLTALARAEAVLQTDSDGR